MDPAKPDTLYAASYQRRRTPRGFNGGGPGSGIWKTTDGGKTWQRTDGQRLPGRAARPHRPRSLPDRSRTSSMPRSKSAPSGGTGAGVGADGKPTTPGAGRAGQAGAAVRRRRPRGAGRRTASSARPQAQRRLALGRRGQDVEGREQHQRPADVLQPDPRRSDQPGDRLPRRARRRSSRSTAARRSAPCRASRTAITTRSGSTRRTRNHVMFGNDGGLDVSYDQGETWDFVNTMASGQFYAISADMRKPYYVCGGLQDNGTLVRPEREAQLGGHPQLRLVPRRRRRRLLHAAGSDRLGRRLRRVAGRQRATASTCGRARTTSIRPARRARAAGAGRRRRRQQLAQMAAQFGMQAPSAASNVVPEPPAGETFRFFWNTPFVLSPHNPRHRVGGRQPAVQVAEPRRHVHDVARTSRATSAGSTRPIMGVAGRRADGLEARRRRRRTASSPPWPSRRSCRASSGWAPTTATCR